MEQQQTHQQQGPPATAPVGMTAQQLIDQLQEMQRQQGQMAAMLQASQARQLELEQTVLSCEASRAVKVLSLTHSGAPIS